ncbi:hypothetical protein GSI_05815 [Ganoderma sinense ZZ0214-1]|uniref:Uncharacterized protein n=1 Tax=Ganoderma sinense ZZ0214-1 TaxID=1077348 RepID=A0A2G8SBI3_9APHY|nr:hypothetical protein GSI_05815 [Ganoderma sinense ZZ0214-1]
MAPVDLWKGELMDRFHAFIFANEQARAPCIYGLTIGAFIYYDLSYANKSDFQTISDRLVAIVKAAVHLQYLDFRTFISDSVFDAMVKLTTLHELHIITDVPTYEEKLLKHLAIFHSPLRSLHIAGNEFSGSNMPASFLHDRLSHLTPTLEFLDLDEFPVDILPSSVTTQFTAVRSLKLRATFAPDCDLLGVLLRLFPKLDNTLELGSLYDSVRGDNVPAFRTRCQEAQERHRWSRLDRLACHADTAYLLALRCPIRRMEIQVRLPDATQYLAETLRYHCPPHLYVSISFNNGFGALDRLFPPEATDKLTHLVVFADIRIRHGRRSIRRNRGDSVHSGDRFVNRLLNSIQDLHLTHLRIVFHYSTYLQARKTAPDADSVGHNPLGDGMDLQATKARFVDAMPTLEYLFLTASSQTYAIPSQKRLWEFSSEILSKWFASKAWRVVHGGEDLHPSESISESDVGIGSSVELSREAAERIMDREELQLSRDEEYEVRLCADPKGS